MINPRHIFGLIVLAIAIPGTLPAKAVPAALTQCLKSWHSLQQDGMVKTQALMAKGADTSGEQYSKEQLNQIRDHLALNETLKFRCPTFTPPPGLNPKR